MILVDTGFLLALSQPADELHARAVAWAQVVTEPLLLTEYVLCETINNLSKRQDRPRAHRIADLVLGELGYVIVDANPALFQAGLRLHHDRPDKDWSLTDCISFHVMRERGIRQALAFDLHFEQAGFEALLRRDSPV